jgi:hypothetical protein
MSFTRADIDRVLQTRDEYLERLCQSDARIAELEAALREVLDRGESLTEENPNGFGNEEWDAAATRAREVLK